MCTPQVLEDCPPRRRTASNGHPSGLEGGSERVRRLIAAGLAGTLLFGCLAPTALADQLGTYRAQAQTVAVQLSTAQNHYDSAMQAWNIAHGVLVRAEVALRSGAARLKGLADQQQQAEAVLAKREQEVAAAKVVVASDQHKADEGLRTIDENGSVSFLGVLLGANNFGDFLTRLSMLQKIWTMEMGFLGQARLAQAHLEDLERQQQAEVSHIAGLKQQAAAQVVDLQQQQRAALAAKTRQDTAVGAAQAVVNELLTEKNGLAAKIRAILAAIDSGNTSWSQILQLITELASQYGISPTLVEAVVLQESGGQAHAQSSVGAMGLMQLMPSTAAALGVTNAYDPVQNLKGGIEYLVEQLQRFHGNVTLALAAYNAGPGAVEKYGGVPPYAETQRYVNNIMALVKAGK